MPGLVYVPFNGPQDPHPQNGGEAKLCPEAPQGSCEAGAGKALFISPCYTVFVVII